MAVPFLAGARAALAEALVVADTRKLRLPGPVLHRWAPVDLEDVVDSGVGSIVVASEEAAAAQEAAALAIVVEDVSVATASVAPLMALARVGMEVEVAIGMTTGAPATLTSSLCRLVEAIATPDRRGLTKAVGMTSRGLDAAIKWLCPRTTLDGFFYSTTTSKTECLEIDFPTAITGGLFLFLFEPDQYTTITQTRTVSRTTSSG